MIGNERTNNDRKLHKSIKRKKFNSSLELLVLILFTHVRP